jgi:hypothetical protein
LNDLKPLGLRKKKRLKSLSSWRHISNKPLNNKGRLKDYKKLNAAGKKL